MDKDNLVAFIMSVAILGLASWWVWTSPVTWADAGFMLETATKLMLILIGACGVGLTLSMALDN